MKNIIVIGAGAAGMMTSIAAARNNNKVTLIEKNEKAGKKIYITGKGRCNLMNDCSEEGFFESISSNPKFLYSAYNSFDNSDVYSLFEELGLKMKTERGGRVFPVSDHASDVTKVLEKEIKRLGIKLMLNTKVEDLVIENNRIKGVVIDRSGFLGADAVVISTGGMSYPTTGSTGDGFRFASKYGHNIIKPIPSLTGLNSSDPDCARLQGLSLKNVTIRINDSKELLYEDFGEMLFTHFGVSGPIILRSSSRIGRKLSEGSSFELVIDLKAGMTEDELDRRLLRQIDSEGSKVFKNSLDSWMPKSLEPVIIKRSGIDPMKPLKFLTKKDRRAFISTLKQFRINITGLRDFNEAIITKGGVSVKDIDPKTFRSRIIEDLYFTGEVIDVDAITGGYNLLIAWISGYVCGRSIS